MDKDLEKQLVALWLIDVRLNTTHILKEYLEDDEMLSWCKKNIKQRVYESNPKLIEVWYKNDELLFTADEIFYHYSARDKYLIERN